MREMRRTRYRLVHITKKLRNFAEVFNWNYWYDLSVAIYDRNTIAKTKDAWLKNCEALGCQPFGKLNRGTIDKMPPV